MSQSTEMRSNIEAWREQLLSTAEAFEWAGEKKRAAFMRRILREHDEALDLDANERRRILLEREGTVSEVAEETGYTPEHLSSLVKKGKIQNRDPGGKIYRVRYADVWALRGVPVETAADYDQAIIPIRRDETNEPKRDRESIGIRVVS